MDNPSPMISPVPMPQPTGRVLYPLLLLTTLLYFGFEIAELVTNGRYRPVAMFPSLYFALLAAYAGDKELRRWTQSHEEPEHRRGEIFVYAWWGLFAVAFVTTNLRLPYVMPEALPTICLEVLAVFFGTAASKRLHGRSAQRKTSSRSAILDYALQHGGISSKACEELLGVSRRYARMILAELTKEGQLVRDGSSATDPEGQYIPPRKSS